MQGRSCLSQPSSEICWSLAPSLLFSVSPELLWKNLLSISELQGSRRPVVVSHYRDRAVIISLPAHVCEVLLLLFLLVLSQRISITRDLKNWCHLLIADLYTLLAKKELSHPAVFSLNSNVLHSTTSGCTHTDKTQRMLWWSGTMFLSGAPVLLTRSHSFLSLLSSIVGRKKF